MSIEVSQTCQSTIENPNCAVKQIYEGRSYGLEIFNRALARANEMNISNRVAGGISPPAYAPPNILVCIGIYCFLLAK